MQITLNGKPREVAPATTIEQLLVELGVQPAHVAVELNLELVTRRRHAVTALAEGDRLEVVTLVGGG